MRKLATVRPVSNIRPIEGKDRIEQLNVDGWNVIVKKGEFNPNDLCVYIEIDSKLPERPEFEFLKDKKYIIKTMKMSGVRSEGIVFPLSILKRKHKLGDDVTKELGITQYNKELEVKKTLSQKVFSYFMKYPWFRKLFKKTISKKKITSSWPNWIRKTDEDRIQNNTKFLTMVCDWSATEKLDGCSATYAIKDGEYIICSRNNRMYDEDNVWARIGKKYNMEEVLKVMYVSNEAKHSIVIQGEIIGPKIQGNKYNLTEPEFYAFNLIIDGETYDLSYAEDLHHFPDAILRRVPVVFPHTEIVGKTVDEILDIATFKSSVNPNILAEGLVFRTYDVFGRQVYSFKAVSPSFLIKNNE